LDRVNNQSLPPQENRNAFQILSLSGGGFLGLYTIEILVELEKQLGRPIATSFDLLAGTSVGGLIALALAAEVPAEEIKKAFETKGSEIFSARSKPKSATGKLIDFLRSLSSSKYNGEGLKETILQVLGADTTIGDLKHPVIVPTVNLTTGKPQFFKTDHHPDFQRDYKLKAMDVALATSAAPTYFPIAEIGDELFADGGLYANSPDLIAIHEAEHFFDKLIDEIRMLSIGTTTTGYSLSHNCKRNIGLYGWGKNERLSNTIISSQQQDVDFIVGHRLSDRYLRIDSVPSNEQEEYLGLDVATIKAQKTIRGLASGAYQKYVNNPILIEILKYKAEDPHFYYSNGDVQPDGD